LAPDGKIHPIPFRLRLRPRPRLGELTAPTPSSCIQRVPLIREERGEKERKRQKVRKGREKRGKGRKMVADEKGEEGRGRKKERGGHPSWRVRLPPGAEGGWTPLIALSACHIRSPCLLKPFDGFRCHLASVLLVYMWDAIIHSIRWGH